MKIALPVSDSRRTRAEVTGLGRAHIGQVIATIVTYGLTSAAGLGAPWLLGMLIDSVDQGGTTTVDAIALAVAGFVVAESVFSAVSHFISGRLTETVMARLRNDFVRRSLALPPATVEQAGTGDLMTRSSRDINNLGEVMRRAAPESLVHLVTLVLTLGALTIADVWLALAAIVATVPVLWGPVRWYLRRAPKAYLAESAAYSDIAEELAATVEGARTVEALGLQQQRIDTDREAIAKSFKAERRTLSLRNVFMPTLDFGVTLPIAVVMLVGGLMYGADLVSLGAVTAAVLYINQAGEPMFMLVGMLDELQTGNASLARILGVGAIPATAANQPNGSHHSSSAAVAVRQVSYAYTAGHDVLHQIDLEVSAGERLAIVGPSGAGKSTLGKLIAGIDTPERGTITVAGHNVAQLSLQELRNEILLVTQEHHVFAGTLRDNLALADPTSDDARITSALATVDAEDWLRSLPRGLDTVIGSAQLKVQPAQAQQIALARLVLADPDVLVLDEATSLLDPRAARHLERHLARVLHGRTVIAIAHRLHTAHDADRVAVVENGRIAELGPHDELVAADGHYASLWRSWQG